MNSPVLVTLATDDCLSPVFAEVARSLQQVRQKLEQAPVTDADWPGTLRWIAASLGQVGAALSLAGADRLAAITALSQHLIIQRSEDSSSFPDDLTQALNHAFGMMQEAMDRSLLHEPFTVLELLPCWTALAAWDGTGNAHPSALLSLQADYPLLETVVVPEEAMLQSDLCGAFERALLRFLRSTSAPEEQEAAQRMTLVIATIASREKITAENVGWRVLLAAVSLIASGSAGDIALSKKILAATGRVIRHLGPTGLLPLPPSLVKEALFAVAMARSHTVESTCISQAFDLPAQWPVGDPKGVFVASDNALAIGMARDALQALIVQLETSGGSVLPIPAQLDLLISRVNQVPEFACVTTALSRLQARLGSAEVHPGQALALAACLLSLGQWMGCRKFAIRHTAISQRIAAALDMIGDQEGIPTWRTLHQMGAALYLPSTLEALTQALTGSLMIIERQTERLLEGLHTPAEHEAAMVAIDQRLAEIDAALHLLGESAMPVQLETIRDQLRVFFHDLDSDQNLPARDEFAQQFVRLSARIAAMPRAQDVPTRILANDDDLASVGDDKNTLYRPVFDTDDVLHTIFLDEATDRIGQLRGWFQTASPSTSFPFELAAHAAHALAGCSATVGLSEMRQLALAMEAVLTSMRVCGGQITVPAQIIFDDTLTALEQMLVHLSSGIVPQVRPAVLGRLLGLSPGLSLDALASTLATNGETEAQPKSEPETETETETNPAPQLDAAPAPQTSPETSPETSPAPNLSQFYRLPDTQLPEPTAGASVSLLPVTLSNSSAEAATDSAEKTTPFASELHDELHDIFIEEAADLMPQLDQQLRAWIHEPLDSAAPVHMLRVLHTLKGSARMAGEIALGDALHQMEQTVAELSRQTPPDTAALRVLEETLDQLLQPFVSGTSAAPSGMAEVQVAGLTRPTDVHPTAINPQVKNSSNTSQTLTDLSAISAQEKSSASLQLRVRADFLDLITNAGAELLVGSSRMANELQLQRQSVNDLSENLGRLRSQLRELEIHAESRIDAGFTQTSAAEFDPLEFDRYTRLHELTRMMNESIADIGSLQRTLSRQLDNAALAVTAQGRHARILQSDLRRVRTLPFASLSGRLQHLLRQVARDKACEVTLEIDGGNVEVDRGVLDRLTGPLEHLVRNAVAHGIETAVERQSQGKPAAGRVRMVLSQQGNTLWLQISDDGRGLDYQRIRQRAMALGLLTPEISTDDAALSDLIFEPGFSTANEITELSGRGIGMDAVRAAVLALGGQLKVSSQSGAGTCFMLSLPLTLATMQVVLVTAGSSDVALPATLVQQMLQLSSSELVQARTTGALEWQGRSLPLHRLATLLCEPMADTEIVHRTPVAVLRQLDQYLAIELEAVTGHREVVVKNLGPQLVRVPGLAGATVLGDGSITLIINPLPLPEFVATLAHHPAIEATSDTRARQLPRILVVDDSLTVRRASQRLLERHGYAVALARDGLDALEQLRLHLPVAILLDIEMPRMDGFELLSALRDDPRWRDPPVAMITSRTAERHREHAMKLGASAYLGKPFVEEELLCLLTQWLAPVSAELTLDLARAGESASAVVPEPVRCNFP